MKQEYQKILDEMILNKNFTEFVDGRKLLVYLSMNDAISTDEQKTLCHMGPRESFMNICSFALKSKTDKSMKIFLNSLELENYRGVHTWLKGKIEEADRGDQSFQIEEQKIAENITKLSRAFRDNPVPLQSYMPQLTMFCVLDQDEVSSILKSENIKDQQIELIKRLATKEVEKIKLLKNIAQRNCHTAFAKSLEEEGY